jgi:hypothetical protein
MAFADKARRRGSAEAESQASGPHPTFDSTKLSDWAYDPGRIRGGLFAFLSPEAADHTSVVFFIL